MAVLTTIKHSIIVLLLSFCAIDCWSKPISLPINSSEKVTDGKVDDAKFISLKGEPVKVAERNEYIYPTVLIGNTFINRVVWSGEPDYNLSRFGKNGFEAPEAIFRKASDYRFMCFGKGKNNSLLFTDAYGNGLSSLTVIPDASSIENISDTTKWEKYDLSKFSEKFIANGMEFCPMSDSTILIAGAPEVAKMEVEHEYLLSIINFKKQTCIPLKFQFDDGIEATNFDKFWVYTSNAYLYGNGKGRYLFKYLSTRFAFIFTIEGDRINVVKYLYKTFPQYDPGDGNTPIVSILRPEKMQCETTNDNIFVLLTYKDKTGKALTPEEYERQALYGDIVEIYDWDGNKQKKVLKLDHIGQRIKISDDGKTLFLLTDDIWEGEPTQQIWSYDISNLDSSSNVAIMSMTGDNSQSVSKNAVKKTSAKKATKIVEEGDMMADFELFDYDDKPHHLNEFVGKGKYTILEFSGLGCAPCQAAKPYLEKLYKENHDKFEMITISTDNEKLWKKKPSGEVSWNEWNDHKSGRDIALKYGVKGIPTFIIVDPDGRVKKKITGFNEKMIDLMRNWICTKK